MNRRINVNGVLYEAVNSRKRPAESEHQGKFNQVVYESYSNGSRIFISIVSSRDTDKKFYKKPLFELVWFKKSTASFVNVGSTVTGDYDNLMVSEDITATDLERIHEHILDMDSSLSHQWKISDVEKLITYLENRFDYIPFDEFLDDASIDDSWSNAAIYDQDAVEDAISDIVNGREDFDIIYDEFPNYDSITRDIQDELDDSDALRSWDNHRISKGLQ